MDPITGALESPTATPAPSVTVAEGTSTGDLLSQIQAADKSAQEPVASETPSEPEEKAEAAPAESVTEPETEEPAVEEPKEGEAGKEPQATQEQVAESIRSLIKKSNLPPEKKEELAGLAYEGLQLRKMGFDFQQAKFLKEMGVTPDVIVDRVKLHGTLDDAKTDAMYAQDMRELISDLTTNPAVAARKLHATSPEHFRGLAVEVADNLDSIIPEKAVQIRSDGARNMLLRIQQDAQREGNTDMETAATLIYERVFGTQPGAPPRTPDMADPTQRELAQLKQQLAQQERVRREAFTRDQQVFGQQLQSRGADAILADIRATVDAQKPAGLNDELTAQIAREAFDGVTQDLLANENFVKDVERFTAGQPTSQNFQQALEFVRHQARARTPIHLRAALTRWGKYAVQQSAQKQAIQQKAEARPDVGKAVGPATPSVGSPLHEQILAEGRSKNLSPLEMIQRHDALLKVKR